jgi:hypothetical protein
MIVVNHITINDLPQALASAIVRPQKGSTKDEEYSNSLYI